MIKNSCNRFRWIVSGPIACLIFWFLAGLVIFVALKSGFQDHAFWIMILWYFLSPFYLFLVGVWIVFGEIQLIRPWKFQCRRASWAIGGLILVVIGFCWAIVVLTKGIGIKC